jgi:large subunit ribosomal protein L49
MPEAPMSASPNTSGYAAEPSISAQDNTQTNAKADLPRPPQLLPYYVGRNSMNNMSVYERRGRGGNLKKTLLKKGEGNLQALRFDVAAALGLTEKEVKVNTVTNHIEIKVGTK